MTGLEEEVVSAAAAATEAAQPVKAADIAVQCPNTVAEMRRLLRLQNWAVPAQRFAFEDDSAELMRYAMAAGYLTATSPEQCAAALQAALLHISETMTWAEAMSFMRPRDMRGWGHVVCPLTVLSTC